MRRRWKLLVAAGALAFVAGLLFLRAPQDDGLDWVRKYGGREVVSKGKIKDSPSIYFVRNEFYFDNGVPEGLTAQLHAFNERWKRMTGKRAIYFVSDKPMVGFVTSSEDWLEGHWVRFKRRIGWGP